MAELERVMGQEDRDDPVEEWEKAGIDVNALLCAQLLPVRSILRAAPD